MIDWKWKQSVPLAGDIFFLRPALQLKKYLRKISATATLKQ
jgi:hypothetical protein